MKIVVFPVGKCYGYDGIVEFNKKKYIVAQSCRTPEEALKKATRAARKISQTVGRCLALYPEVK